MSRGFTLLEVLVALAIVALAVVTMVQLSAHGLRLLRTSEDYQEAVRLADYLYILGEGVIVAHGPTQDMVASDDPFVHQFLHAQPDGPVRFHFPARPFADELGL